MTRSTRRRDLWVTVVGSCLLTAVAGELYTKLRAAVSQMCLEPGK